MLTGEHRRQEEALQKAKDDLEQAEKTATEKSKYSTLSYAYHTPRDSYIIRDLKRFENEFPVCKRQLEETERELAGVVQREKQLSAKVHPQTKRIQKFNFD